ncbi:Probable G-protein coupled receptor Mth-like 1 [Gryllus bimaculatus]|nr:Probable G-protein coupled receptor Mth-like 1 [Gryllus bimaculatus]
MRLTQRPAPRSFGGALAGYVPSATLRVGVVRPARPGAYPACRGDRTTPSYVLCERSVYLTEYSMVVAGAGAYCLDARRWLVCVSQSPRGSRPARRRTRTPAPGPVASRAVRRATSCRRARCGRDADCRRRVVVLAAAGPSALFRATFSWSGCWWCRNGSPLVGVDAPPGAFACHARILAGAAAVRPVADPDADDVRFTLYPVGLMLSVFFLAATLAAGCLLPGAHHALHWRCQTAHVACLMVGDLLLAVTQMAGTGVPPELCHATGKLFVSYPLLAKVSERMGINYVKSISIFYDYEVDYLWMEGLVGDGQLVASNSVGIGQSPGRQTLAAMEVV